MPTYDYTCTLCSHTLEASQKMSEAPLVTCPACHQNGLKRGIGGGSATFRFVGDGFYITDYKKECSKTSSACCPCKDPS